MCLASLINPTWIYLLSYSARVPPPKGKSMSILFYIYRDPSKWNQWSSKSRITSTEFVGNLQHHNNIQSCSVHFFRNADQQVYVVIYFRESKNDKNFIWHYSSNRPNWLLFLFVIYNYSLHKLSRLTTAFMISEFLSMPLLKPLQWYIYSVSWKCNLNVTHILLKSSRTNEKNKNICFSQAFYIGKLWSVKHSAHKRIHSIPEQNN